MARRMSYFRLKRLRLGETLERFLEENLQADATILLVECALRWPTTRAGERHVFQFGGLGGATLQEFFGGGPRVESYLGRYGSGRLRWEPPPADGESPEAEWGFEPELAEDVERFARERGYRLRRLVFEQPEDLSPLVADLYRRWYVDRGIPAGDLQVGSFVLLQPHLVIQRAEVPFWMAFNTEPSAEALERYLDTAGPFDRIGLTLFSHGVESVGVVPIDRWRSILQRAVKSGYFAGVDPHSYPRDFAVFARHHMALRRSIPYRPLPRPLTLEEVEQHLREMAGRYPVSWL